MSPADPPHGTRHAQILALVEAHVAAGYEVACDLLTRTSDTSDIAPDVSVYPEAPNPDTGGRQLEQLAIEVVSTQALCHAARTARKLGARGVRRVLAVDIERSRAVEWSGELDSWTELAPAGCIGDPTLAVPLPIDALVRSARADDAVARALLAKRNPVLEAARARDREEGTARGRAEGAARGRAEALIVLLTARGISLDPAVRDRVLGERDPQRLERWIARAAHAATLADALDLP